jgi:hypothetical protein
MTLKQLSSLIIILILFPAPSFSGYENEYFSHDEKHVIYPYQLGELIKELNKETTYKTLSLESNVPTNKRVEIKTKNTLQQKPSKNQTTIIADNQLSESIIPSWSGSVMYTKESMEKLYEAIKASAEE